MTEEQIQYDEQEAEFAQSVVKRAFVDELIRVRRRPGPHDFELIKDFYEFCRGAGVTPLPAKPSIVACWLMLLLDEGQPKAAIRSAAKAIEILHDLKQESNPCATSAVRSVLLKNRELDRSTDNDTEVKH